VVNHYGIINLNCNHDKILNNIVDGFPKGGFEAQVSGQTGYQAFIAQGLDRLAARPEFSGAVSWYRERVAGLPEMTVEDTALTGTGGWDKEMTDSGEVARITSRFFDIPGRQVTVTRADGQAFSWNQAGIVQSEGEITLPTPEAVDITMDVSGFVGLLRDTEGNVLLTVGQEPYAKTNKRALVRTPLQTSAAKLAGLLDGKTELDPNLANVFEKISPGTPISELFTAGAVETFPLAPADPNRIDATNIGFAMTVTDPGVRDGLAVDGSNRWFNPTEVQALIRAGVVNGHTAAVYAAAA
jgi:hypothetical protein